MASFLYYRRDGEIGRHARLKIVWKRFHESSSLSRGTKMKPPEKGGFVFVLRWNENSHLTNKNKSLNLL